MKFFPFFITLLFTTKSAVSQDLRITEIMADSHVGGDWFELTNHSEASINLAGFSWDDQSAMTDTVIFPDHILDSGKSLIFLIQPQLFHFREWWELNDSVAVLLPENYELCPRFDDFEDEINLFSPRGDLIDSFRFVGPHQVGRSRVRLLDGAWVPYGQSHVIRRHLRETKNPHRAVEFWRYDKGNPGEVSPAYRFRPELRSKRSFQQWHESRDLATSPFRLYATDPNPDDILTISGVDLPDWLELVNESNAVAKLVGTPPPGSVGRHTFQIIVSDDTGLKSVPSPGYTLDVLPNESPIILNEFNAVSHDQFLGGGGESDQGGEYDNQLGRIAGNGGFWAEFVIVGKGMGEEEVDIRGWNFAFDSDSQILGFKLTQDPMLSAIPAGTILTFTERNVTSATLLNDSTMAKEEGYFWTNFNLHDERFVEITPRNDPFDPIRPWSGQFEVWVLGSDGGVIMGPSGEKVARRDPDGDGIFEKKIKVGMDEVFKLEADASRQTSPIFGNYDDGETSTFGRPNEWNQRSKKQDFRKFIPTNLPPIISGTPAGFCVRNKYREQLSISDPEGQAVIVTLIDSPDFLSVTEMGPRSYDLHLNRDIEPDDWGTYLVTVKADDGAAIYSSCYLTIELTISNPEPSVIVNEFNAVSRDSYLNGGRQLSDLDGEPVAVDTTLGRILGNGGNWLELAVVGDGGPSVVDLRGWKVEVFAAADLGKEGPWDGIEFNFHPDLGAVPAGTIVIIGPPDHLQIIPEDRMSTEGWRQLVVNRDSGYLHNPEMIGISLPLNVRDALIRIVNREGRTIFGPVGETTVAGVQLGDDEVFELEAHPSPLISSYESGAKIGDLGYDDSDSESTLGTPNRFLNSEGRLVTQNFSAFIPLATNFREWAASFGLAGDSEIEDDDQDGFSNLEEYMAGSIPNDRRSLPTKPMMGGRESVFEIRVSDPEYEISSELSYDLLNWTTEYLQVTDTPSHLGNHFRRRILTEDRNPPMRSVFFRSFIRKGE